MPEELSAERKAEIRRQIAEERGGYKRQHNPKFNPAYDKAYIEAKKLIEKGFGQCAAYARAGITGDAFRLRAKWEAEGK